MEPNVTSHPEGPCCKSGKLKRPKQTVERTNDGEECLKKVESFLPDVILLDYLMPKMDGIQVVKRLKQDSRYQGIPVILLTAKASPQDKVQGLDAGADDYFAKPFERFELLAWLRSMVRIKQLHGSLEESRRTLAKKVSQQVDEIQFFSSLLVLLPELYALYTALPIRTR